VSGRVTYAVAGAGLAAGAPLGLLLIRAGGRLPVDPTGLGRELTTDPVTYAYVTLSTLVVFTLLAINEGGGHRAGDLGLQAVARALRDGGRRADMSARIGGDEFAVIAPSTPGPAAAALGERIRSLVVAQGIERLTVSIGVATLGSGRALGGRDLRETADAALYDAKRQGKNRVVAA